MIFPLRLGNWNFFLAKYDVASIFTSKRSHAINAFLIAAASKVRKLVKRSFRRNEGFGNLFSFAIRKHLILMGCKNGSVTDRRNRSFTCISGELNRRSVYFESFASIDVFICDICFSSMFKLSVTVKLFLFY